MEPGSLHASLATAVAYGQPLFDQVRTLAKDLPKRADVPSAPTSWADAQALVAARDEEKRKKEASTAKSKGGKPVDQSQQTAAQPGTAVGNISGSSAFWLFVVGVHRICSGVHDDRGLKVHAWSLQEDYFRDVTAEDMLMMIPHCLDPFQDEALYVPFVGREPAQPAPDDKPISTRKQAAKQMIAEMEEAEVRTCSCMHSCMHGTMLCHATAWSHACACMPCTMIQSPASHQPTPNT
jgi:hypothetical protein